MMISGMRVENSQMAEFLMESHVKKELPKERIKQSEDSFDEMLAAEIRLLDVNYIRTMNILGGR